jgi:sodium-dependent dicarboxylate transporter 2/3/5
MAPESDDLSVRGWVGLIAGPTCFVILLLLSPPDGLTLAGWRTMAVAVLMSIWWITEAIPIPATALLPLALFPLLGIGGIRQVTAPYANPVIYLFLGGFLLAMGFAQSGLHRRMALSILSVVGTRPAQMVLGFMLATAFISMWVSNTATVVMILPMALSVIALTDRQATGEDRGVRREFEVALLLGVAFAATIGGLGTLIGSPPNALFAAFMLENYGIRIGFGAWMLMALPVVIVTLPITWWLLVRVLHRLSSTPIAGGAELLGRERDAMGVMTRTEWTVGAIATATSLAWIARPFLETSLPGLSDTGIAVIAGLLLFLIPVGNRPLRFVLTWEQAERLPWSVLILFGGGLSLAGAIQEQGVAEWIGARLGLVAGWPELAVIAVVVVAVILLSELASNTAVAAAFLPVAASLAAVTGFQPQLLTLGTALAASCAFMLPVATPPNAVVFGTGKLRVSDMVVAGVWLNLLFIVLLPLVVLYLGRWAFG